MSEQLVTRYAGQNTLQEYKLPTDGKLAAKCIIIKDICLSASKYIKNKLY